MANLDHLICTQQKKCLTLSEFNLTTAIANTLRPPFHTGLLTAKLKMGNDHSS